MNVLKVGSSGDDVGHVQELLNLLVITPSPLKVDGIFGPKTEARVKQFQTNSRLTSDGVVGPVTGKALVAAVVTTTLRRS